MSLNLSSKEWKAIERLYIAGCDVTVNEKMQRKTSIEIGGPVKAFVVPHTVKSLVEALTMLQDYGISYKVMGFGTNLLVSDKPLDFFVVSTERLNGIYFKKGIWEVEAGASLKRFIQYSALEGFGGAEELYGIPGSVGGAIFMNAGAYGKEIKDIFLWADVFDGRKIKRLYKDEMNFSYRRSGIKSEIVLRAGFKLEKMEREKIFNGLEHFLKKRLEKQPIFEKSAGSLFKRPRPDFYVGSTLEKLGFKGYKMGGIKISEKHAGFMVNEGNGKFEEAIKLIEIIKKTVKEKYDVELETEVVIWK